MSEESTTPDSEQALRQGLEALSRGDLDAQIGRYSEGAVWDRSAMGLEVLNGREAILGVLEDWRASYEDYEVVADEFRDLGNDVTFAVLLTRARPRGSGGLVELRSAVVTAWANGLIERLASYTDVDEGRAAAERLAQERG
jgi:ketosteroid isomerase-like protein